MPSDRSELNDMLGQSPETQFLAKPKPTPTPTPAPQVNSNLLRQFQMLMAGRSPTYTPPNAPIAIVQRYQPIWPLT